MPNPNQRFAELLFFPGGLPPAPPAAGGPAFIKDLFDCKAVKTSLSDPCRFNRVCGDFFFAASLTLTTCGGRWVGDMLPDPDRGALLWPFLLPLPLPVCFIIELCRTGLLAKLSSPNSLMDVGRPNTELPRDMGRAAAKSARRPPPPPPLPSLPTLPHLPPPAPPPPAPPLP